MVSLVASYRSFFRKVESAVSPIDGILFFVRAYIANVFYASAKTKMDGFLSLNDFTIDLFYNEYGFPLFEYGCKPVTDEWGDTYEMCQEILSAETAAHLAMYGEVFFPLMLMIGLASRLGAAGLMAMTLFIQFYVYPAQFHEHLVWFAALALVFLAGPGRISIDALVAKRISPTG